MWLLQKMGFYSKSTNYHIDKCDDLSLTPHREEEGAMDYNQDSQSALAALAFPSY